ncbi:MAG: ATP synthase F1 subunit epsilon [Opitutales bacterium]|nr:ATP synthase F1 subunit epsilon [Opitutales bacterium]
MFVEIVTPEGTLISKEVDGVVLPTIEGETGVLPGHIPLITKIQRGELKLQEGTNVDLIAVDTGYAEVIGDRVAILTEGAVDIEDVDLGSIQAAQQRATEALEEAKTSDLDPAEIEQLETRLQFLMTQKLIKETSR